MKLQVYPSVVQTDKADFTFTFTMFRDLGINKTAFVRIDFQQYFN